jgi:hypothetical protein
VAKPQVSSLRRVRVSGKYLHRECPGRWPGHSRFSGVRVPFSLPRGKRVAIRITLAPHERTTSVDYADESAFDPMHESAVIA